MEGSVVPDVRPGLVVVARAIVAGALLGAVVGTAIMVGDPTDAGASADLIGIPVTAGVVGAGVAALSAAAWLLTVGHGPRWAAEAVAGAVAALPFGALTWISQAWWAACATILVGGIGGLVARWQGYERDRPQRPVRPRTSPRAG